VILLAVSAVRIGGLEGNQSVVLHSVAKRVFGDRIRFFFGERQLRVIARRQLAYVSLAMRAR
jgi:hypothetical protein